MDGGLLNLKSKPRADHDSLNSEHHVIEMKCDDRAFKTFQRRGTKRDLFWLLICIVSGKLQPTQKFAPSNSYSGAPYQQKIQAGM